jgi:hypothetical protein
VTLPAWHEEPVGRSHDRRSFDCGDADLNAFLQRFARQGHEQNAVKTFCTIEDEAPNRVLGLYGVAPSRMTWFPRRCL